MARSPRSSASAVGRRSQAPGAAAEWPYTRGSGLRGGLASTRRARRPRRARASELETIVRPCPPTGRGVLFRARTSCRWPPTCGGGDGGEGRRLRERGKLLRGGAEQDTHWFTERRRGTSGSPGLGAVLLQAADPAERSRSIARLKRNPARLSVSADSGLRAQNKNAEASKADAAFERRGRVPT